MMGLSIHHKQTDDGPRYRAWSSVTDSYFTPEMTRLELTQWLIMHNLRRYLDREGMGFPQWLERHPVDEWDQIRDEWGDDFPNDDAADYINNKLERIFAEGYEGKPVVIDGKKFRITIGLELVE